MAERIVSPGVFTRENDLSFLAQGIGEIGGAFIGPFKQGPAFVPTIVRTQSEFETIFGTPDGTFYTEYAVQNYLREAGSATIVRVAGTEGYTQNAPVGIFASGSGFGDKLVGVLFNTKVGATYQAIDSTGSILDNIADKGSFIIKGNEFSGTTGISASILPSDVNDLKDVFGESPFGSKNAYAYLYFESSASLFPTTDVFSSVYSQILDDQDFTDEALSAVTPWIKSQVISGDRYDLFRFHTIGQGEVYNKKYKVSISNVKAAGEDGSTDYATFTVTLRGYGDTDRRKSVIEQWGNVNLDPSSPRYIARVIGDRYFTIDNNGKITENGDYSNKSLNVWVEVSEAGSFPISAAPFGHGAYTNPIRVSAATKVPAVVYQTGSAANNSSSPIYFSGFDYESVGAVTDNTQYLKPIPANAGTGANVAFAFDSQLSYQLTGSAASDMVKRQFVVAFQGGFDGVNPIVKLAKAGDADWGAGNNQGLNCTNLTSAGSQAYVKAINALSNPDEYDINLVVAPGINRELHPAVTQKLIDMCEERQDCFYIADFTDYQSSITTATEQANSVDSNYVACYYPWLKTIDVNTNKLTTVPPSVLLPAVFASSDRLAAEWFAPAGLNRGGITGAVSVLNRLTHSERDTLYENKVNPIASFPGQGIVAFGQKTLQDKASALDRINVRRLLIAVKKFIASTSRYLVFEQNTAETRSRFINTVNPYLESIQQRQGLYAFNVVMDDSNNTPDVIDRNILAGAIYLQPTKTAEFIIIDFNILPTGASFSA
jgi:hypothetical protein